MSSRPATSFSVRSRAPADEPALASLFDQSFERPLAKQLDTGSLWRASNASLGARGAEFAVAEANGRLVGMVAWAWEADDAPKGAGELDALYVLPELHGSGVGQTLHDTAVGALAKRRRSAVLWVAQWNGRAKAFYRRNGWQHDRVTVKVAIQGTEAWMERWSRGL